MATIILYLLVVPQSFEYSVEYNVYICRGVIEVHFFFHSVVVDHEVVAALTVIDL